MAEEKKPRKRRVKGAKVNRSKEYYNLEEEEMQVLLTRAKNKDGVAQAELLKVFHNFLTKYVSLLYYGKLNLNDYDQRKFLSLFVKDNAVRFALIGNKLKPIQYKEVIEVLRGIQYMVVRYCLAGETEVITLEEGTKPIKDLVDKNVTVLSIGGRSNGGWTQAKVESFGVQPLKKIVLKRYQTTKELYATSEHRWFVREKVGRSEVRTSDLKAGDRLVSVYGHMGGGVALSPYGVAAGIVYGDGSNYGIQTSTGHVTLYDKKIPLIKWFSPLCKTRIVVGGQYKTPGIEVSNIPRFWKDNAPNLQEASDYLYSWLAGYFATDGSLSKNGCPSITSFDLWRLEKARDIAYRLGVPVLNISQEICKSGFSPGSICYKLSFPVGVFKEEFFLREEHKVNWRPRSRFSGLRRDIVPEWEVIAVENTDRVEEVYCAIVPDYGNFTLADNILTGNSETLDVEQTIALAFISCIDRYEQKGAIPFSGFLYSYFFYVLKKHVDTHLIDQLGRKTFPLITEEDLGEDDNEGAPMPPGFVSPPLPSAEELIFIEEIDEKWVMDCSHRPFSELTVQERQLLKWRYVDGQRSNEIALRVSEHQNTIREKINRAKVRLAEVVKEDLAEDLMI